MDAMDAILLGAGVIGGVVGSIVAIRTGSSPWLGATYGAFAGAGVILVPFIVIGKVLEWRSRNPFICTCGASQERFQLVTQECWLHPEEPLESRCPQCGLTWKHFEDEFWLVDDEGKSHICKRNWYGKWIRPNLNTAR
jgi:hypothetical protein